jgi:hypothetical protein
MARSGWARIAVHDGGSVTTSVPRPVNAVEEPKFGLGLVEMLADRWDMTVTRKAASPGSRRGRDEDK